MLSKQFPPRLANDPMHIALTKQGNNWDEDIQPGKDEAEMRDRFKSSDAVSHKPKDDTYLDKWTKRTRGKKDKPRYKGIPNHPPIIMQEDEFVRFQGPAPFFVMLIPEPALKDVVVTNPFVNSDPGVPFSEYSTQRDSTTGLYFVQKQVRRGNDVVNQLFWKMIFVVLDDDEPKVVDPDFFCDR